MTISPFKKLQQNENNYILIAGSNLGDRQRNIKESIKLLEKYAIRIIRKSKVYCSSPWGYQSSNSFLNQAMEIECSDNPFKLLEKIKAVELEMGRTYDLTAIYSDRNIDIDIILYGYHIINSETLIIPHPKMDQRKFVLEPVCELLPEFIHPVLKKSISQLLSQCADEGKVSVFLDEQVCQ